MADPSYDQMLNEAAGKIVEMRKLAEKDAAYLNRELDLNDG